MNTRCCTPPAIGGDDRHSSCRHLFFMNDDDDREDGTMVFDDSVTRQPSESLPRPSDTRTSVDSRQSDSLDINVRLPSPPCRTRSPRRAFQPIAIHLPSDSHGRTSFQGWQPAEKVSSTPWRPSTESAAGSLAPPLSAAGGMTYLQTPEVQRVNRASAAATSTAMANLLYTPQIPQVCLAWRANLDAELDAVNAQHPADQLPPVTQLIENALYIGGFPDAQTIPILRSLSIRHVINCCAQDYRTCPEVANEFCVHGLQSFDMDDYLILHHDYEAFAQLVSTLLSRGQKVFVHCIAGVNRSVTLAAAYLMDRYALTPVEAARAFRANGRMRILDNRGFRHQLVDHYLQSVEPHKGEQDLY